MTVNIHNITTRTLGLKATITQKNILQEMKTETQPDPENTVKLFNPNNGCQ